MLYPVYVLGRRSGFLYSSIVVMALAAYTFNLLTDPIAKFVFIVRFGKVVTVKTDATNGLAILLEANGIGLGCGQHRANDLAAVLHARVGRPPGRYLFLAMEVA